MTACACRRGLACACLFDCACSWDELYTAEDIAAMRHVIRLWHAAGDERAVSMAVGVTARAVELGIEEPMPML